MNIKNLLKTVMAAVLLTVCGVSNVFADVQREVNVYSAREPELIDPIFAKFTEKTGIKVNSLFLKDGLLDKLKAEKDLTQADLVLTADVGNLLDVVSAGLAAPVDSAVLKDTIPAQFRDAKDNQWFGITKRVRIFAVNPVKVKDGSLSTYADLAKPEWKGKICTRSGMHPYMVSLLASVIADKGVDYAEKWAKGLRDNLAVKPTGGDRDQIKSVAAGLCDVAVTNHYYYGILSHTDEGVGVVDKVKLVVPEQGQGQAGAYANISGMLMTKSAPHAGDAQKLMEYLVSTEGQQQFVDKDYEFPVQGKSVKLPESYKDFAGIYTVNPLPLNAVADHRSQALKIMFDINYDGGATH